MFGGLESCGTDAHPAARKRARIFRFMQSFLYSTFSSLQIWHEESRERVAHADAEPTAVDALQRDGPRAPALLLDPLLESRRERAIVALDVELEVQPETARIQVRRPEKRPRAVDDENLRVIERRRRDPHPAPAGQDLPEHRRRRPLHDPAVVLFG